MLSQIIVTSSGRLIESRERIELALEQFSYMGNISLLKQRTTIKGA